jgi:hypothetical protein
MTRDKDDWHFGSLSINPLLQVESVKAWKRQIQDEAAWNHCSSPVEKLVRGRESLYLPPFVLYQQLQRFAH